MTRLPAEMLADVASALERVHAVADDLRDEVADALEDGVRSGPRMDRLHRMLHNLILIRFSLVEILGQEGDRS